MMRTAMWIPALLVVANLGWCAEGPKADPKAAQKIKVLLVGACFVYADGGGHDWKDFDSIVLGALRKTGDFEVTVSTKRDDPTLVENFAQYKVVIFYGAGGKFTNPKAEKILDDFVKSGGGLVGVHAVDSYHDSKTYFRLVGAHFDGHGGGNWFVRIMDKNHPITAPLKDFEISDEACRNKFVKEAEPNLHFLIRSDNNEAKQPIGWVQSYEKGRVFNTTLGHDRKSFNNPMLQRFIVRGIYWAAGVDPAKWKDQ
jgi:uncharacterized protein